MPVPDWSVEKNGTTLYRYPPTTLWIETPASGAMKAGTIQLEGVGEGVLLGVAVQLGVFGGVRVAVVVDVGVGEPDAVLVDVVVAVGEFDGEAPVDSDALGDDVWLDELVDVGVAVSESEGVGVADGPTHRVPGLYGLREQSTHNVSA